MLKSLLRKIAKIKEDVQKGSNYDQVNLADDVRQRSPQVVSVVNRTARIYQKAVLGEDVTVNLEEFDVNQSSSLSIQEFVFTSVAENAAANLLTLEILADSEESIEVIDNHIIISIEDGVSDHDSVKALIEADNEASELITVVINSGEGATAVTSADSSEFKGAIG